MDQSQLCMVWVPIKRALYISQCMCVWTCVFAYGILTCIQLMYTCTVSGAWMDSFLNNSIQYRAVLTHYTTIHCSSLIMLGLLSGKLWLFTQKVFYRTEQMTCDWPAHSGLASNLWLTHRSPFHNIIQPNGLVLTPQGNTEERLWLCYKMVD